MTVIGFTGYHGSGKTTAAGCLPMDITMVLPMADPLKAVARSMGWDGQKDARGRRLLQLLGTECGRDCIRQTIWLDKWIERVIEVMRSPNGARAFLIADDVRFPEEAAAIRYLGGIVIRVERRSARPPWWRRALYWAGVRCALHASERPLPAHLVDAVIENEGTVEDLREAVMALVMAEAWNHRMDEIGAERGTVEDLRMI